MPTSPPADHPAAISAAMPADDALAPGVSAVPPLPAPPLDAALRAQLRALAHPLKPVVMIGDAGLSDAVLAEADRALQSHQLIKIRVFSEDRAERDAIFKALTERLGCAPVQAIGKMLVLWRPADPDAEPAAPTRRRRRPRKPMPKKRAEARSEERRTAPEQKSPVAIVKARLARKRPQEPGGRGAARSVSGAGSTRPPSGTSARTPAGTSTRSPGRGPAGTSARTTARTATGTAARGPARAPFGTVRPTRPSSRPAAGNSASGPRSSPRPASARSSDPTTGARTPAKRTTTSRVTSTGGTARRGPGTTGALSRGPSNPSRSGPGSGSGRSPASSARAPRGDSERRGDSDRRGSSDQRGTPDRRSSEGRTPSTRPPVRRGRK